MITKNTTVSQLPKAIEQGFSALEIAKHLRQDYQRIGLYLPRNFPRIIFAGFYTQKLASHIDHEKFNTFWEGCDLPFSQSSFLCLAKVSAVAKLFRGEKGDPFDI